MARSSAGKLLEAGTQVCIIYLEIIKIPIRGLARGLSKCFGNIYIYIKMNQVNDKIKKRINSENVFSITPFDFQEKKTRVKK